MLRLSVRPDHLPFDHGYYLELPDLKERTIRVDKARLTELFGLHFIERHENAIFCGPVGVAKSLFAQALGHAA